MLCYNIIIGRRHIYPRCRLFLHFMCLMKYHGKLQAVKIALLFGKKEASVFGRHALSCRSSEGRHQRHGELNEIIHRTLFSAHLLSQLEPVGLFVQMESGQMGSPLAVPWTCGKLLVWDATCPDTFSPSYAKKSSKYAGLPVTHSYMYVV